MNTATAENKIVYTASAHNFSKIPGSPIAYWVSQQIVKHFSHKQELFCTRAGLTTGDNDYFLRFWYEINSNHIYLSQQEETTLPSWYFHHKGGAFRKWYGNHELILHYDKISLKEMKTRPGFRYDGKEYFFTEGATWNKTGTGNISVRYSDNRFTFNTGGCCLFTNNKKKLYYAIGLLNSNVMAVYLSFLCPTFSFAAGDVERVPALESSTYTDAVSLCVEQNIYLSRADWDSFETSWDFKKHPLI